jgi:archaellin
MVIFLALFAVVLVTMGISTIVRLDGTLAVGGRTATSAVSGPRVYGARARRRAERKASPALFLLASVLTLLVIATLV